MVALTIAKLAAFIGFFCDYYFIIIGRRTITLSAVVEWDRRRREGQTRGYFSGARSVTCFFLELTCCCP